jgi:tetratricopeptide (TPR) repeat protein
MTQVPISGLKNRSLDFASWRTFPLRIVCSFLIAVSPLAIAPRPLQAQATAAPTQTPTVRSAAGALATGDLARAEADLQTILQSTPNDAHALNLLGIVRVQQHREADAEKLFRQAIAVDPGFAGAHASLGLLYVQTQKNDLAIPELQEALKLDPGRKDAQAALVDIYRGQAHAAAQDEDLERALALLIEARKVDANDPDAQYDLGMISLRMSLFPDAAESFEAVLKLRPDDAHALYGLGRTMIALAKFDDAQALFQRYVKLRPQDASGHYALGVTLQAQQQAAAAHAEYEKSIELQPLQTESYFQLGLIELDAGNLDAAAARFDRVLKRAPQHAGALTGMGRVRFANKDYAGAADLFEKAIAADAQFREAHYYLGLTDARLGKKEDSARELEIASRIEHEQVEKHQNVMRVLDPDQVQIPATAPQE